MAMEPKGPGSVGNAYGARTVNQPSQIGSARKLRPNYTEFSQSGGEPATVKTDLVTGGVTISAGGVTVPISTMPAYTPAQGYALAVRASQG